MFFYDFLILTYFSKFLSFGSFFCFQKKKLILILKYCTMKFKRTIFKKGLTNDESFKSNYNDDYYLS